MVLSDSLSYNTLEIIKNMTMNHCLENNFLIFYCFLKIVTSCTAKSRLVGEKRVPDLDSEAKT